MQSDLIIPEVSIYIFIFLSVNKQRIVLRLLRLVDTAKNNAYYLSSRDTCCKNSFSLQPYLMLGPVIPTGLHMKTVFLWPVMEANLLSHQTMKINIVSNYLWIKATGYVF